MHRPVDHIAFALGELFILSIPFRFAQALQDHLFGRLGSNPAEVFRSRFHQHHIARFGDRIIGARDLQLDLGLRILNAFNHFLLGKDGHVPGVQLNLGRDLLGAGCIHRPPIGRNHRRFQRFHHDVPR